MQRKNVKLKKSALWLAGLIIFAISVALSIPTTALAQFVDRIVRPCGGVSTGIVQVTTTNIIMNPCPGGSVLINGVPIVPGGGIGGSGTANKVAKFTGATTIGNSSLTDNGSALTASLSTSISLTAGNAITYGNLTIGANIFQAEVKPNGLSSYFPFYADNLFFVAMGDVFGNNNSTKIEIDDSLGTISTNSSGSFNIAAAAVTINASISTNRLLRLNAGNFLTQGSITDDGSSVQINGQSSTLNAWQTTGNITLGDGAGLLNSTQLVIDVPGSVLTFGANSYFLTGKMIRYNNVAPANGEVLIGGTAAGNWTAGTISGTSPIVVTNGNNTIAVSCPTCATGATTPGGANTQLQFNDSGAFGGDAGFTYVKATDSATLAGELTLSKALRSGTASNTDLAGTLTVGAGGTITYTFTQTYASAPICVSNDTDAVPLISGASASTTVLTITGSVGHVVTYICVGRN